MRTRKCEECGRLNQADEPQTQKIVIEWGNAIKDLAVSNVFPGNILLKNFGVTRHGRVAFYDKDLFEVNFW